MPDDPAKEGKLIDPDNELMLRVAKGDDEAFRKLFERHHRLAYSVIYRQLGNQSQAEDLVQEAFLRVYRAAATYQPAAKFSTWLFTVVTNLCLNFKRDQARSKLRLLESSDEGENTLEQIAEAPPEDSDGDEREKRARLVREAMQSLPETQRMALILSRYEEKSYEEIAKIMDITVAAVKSLTSRARDTLREKLQKYMDIE
ncbi:MAG: RNA polymerase sigma factor [Planctomycetes bacterium]|nr:RNA polymerase sigma factor [Planctomycetota bacterium]